MKGAETRKVSGSLEHTIQLGDVREMHGFDLAFNSCNGRTGTKCKFERLA